MTVREIAVAGLMIIGSFFCFLSALGLIRYPDLFGRLQASTKGTTFGVGMVMLAVAIHFGEGAPVSRAIAIILFLFVTSPVSGHMLGRVAFLFGVPLYPGTRDTGLEAYFNSIGHKIVPMDREIWADPAARIRESETQNVTKTTPRPDDEASCLADDQQGLPHPQPGEVDENEL